MKPFRSIEDSKKVIDNLKYKLQFSKNKTKDAKDINTLIKTLKSFDDMLVSKYYTDAIETLIYTLIHEYLMMHEAYKNEIPLHSIIENIEFAIRNGAEQKKLEVISILKQHELKNKIESNSVFDKKYANFDKILKNLMNKFKESVLWNLKR